MKRHANRTKFWLLPVWLIAFVAVSGLALGAQPVSANGCISEKFGKKLTCTANDIQVAFADNIRALDGSPLANCADGKTFSFIADFHVTTTASSRYDIGLWFSTDGDLNGDGALSGTCSVNMITTPKVLDPVGGVVDLGSSSGQNLDGDTCRDVTTGSGWGKPNGQVVTVRIDNALCTAGTGGFMKLPNCTSWSQNTGVTCNSPDDTTPGSPSKCSCNVGFTVPIKVETPTITTTKTANPTELNQTETKDVTFSVSVKNNGTIPVHLEKLTDDQYGDITVVAGSIQSTTCGPLPKDIAAGGTYSCSFVVTMSGVGLEAGTELKDTVCASGTDTQNDPVGGDVQTNPPSPYCGDATVTITDVTPAAAGNKCVVEFGCVTVRYKAEITNGTTPAEAVTLSKLADTKFGDITSVHAASTGVEAVLGTTCGQPSDGFGAGSLNATPGAGAIPGPIAASGTYTCYFDGEICGTQTAPHVNQIQAELHDADATVIKWPNPDDPTQVAKATASVTVNMINGGAEKSCPTQ